MVTRILTPALICLPLLLLAGCGKAKEGDNLAALDAQLVNNSADPALRGALADQIMVDPQLVGGSNANRVRPAERPANGAVPANGGAPVGKPAQVAGGPLMRAPAAVDGGAAGGDQPTTLAALARTQRSGNAGACAAKLQYGAGWADRLPAAFPVYPGAALQEAAGTANGACALTAASFTAPAAFDDVINYYYTQAKRAGYDAEHQLLRGDHVLGGTRRDGSAYLITFAASPGGGTDVDLITIGGR